MYIAKTKNNIVMKTFTVNLTRVYKVTIGAKSEDSAMELAEFFIGNPKDESTDNERQKHQFEIQEIEMVMNEAMEFEEVHE